MIIRIQKTLPNAKTPKYATAGSVAFDLYACDHMIIMPGEMRFVHTGIAVEVPPGFEMQVRPRSGLSMKYPNYICNSVGTIDQDYRGEVMVMVKNTNNLGERFEIKEGDRIAQALITPVIQVMFEEVAELTPTDRGAGGFGSTG
jgi:dUTP pyrophosphatase